MLVLRQRDPVAQQSIWAVALAKAVGKDKAQAYNLARILRFCFSSLRI